VLFDLEPGVTGSVRASPLGEIISLYSLLNQHAGMGRI
jgi:hypothetical protein